MALYSIVVIRYLIPHQVLAERVKLPHIFAYLSDAFEIAANRDLDMTLLYSHANGVINCEVGIVPVVENLIAQIVYAGLCNRPAVYDFRRYSRC